MAAASRRIMEYKSISPSCIRIEDGMNDDIMDNAYDTVSFLKSGYIHIICNVFKITLIFYYNHFTYIKYKNNMNYS